MVRNYKHWSCLITAGLGYCFVGCTVESADIHGPQLGGDNPLSPTATSPVSSVIAPTPSVNDGVGATTNPSPPAAPGGPVAPGTSSSPSPGATTLPPNTPTLPPAAPPPPGCGDGVLTPATEQCDNGQANSNALPNACRTNCTAWGCGDGVLDNGEACDDGAANTNAADARCRTTCQLAACGDGITDIAAGEVCDEGAANSDTAANTCRTSCQRATCGDGIRDANEACDDGAANSDAEGSACSTQCATPDCGNGALNAEEQCDDGASNNDTRADACRTSCQKATCGDGVIDSEEACDDGGGNSDATAGACRTDCSTHRCGDGVTDPDEECDGQPECTEDCFRAECGNGVTEGTEQCDGEEDCRDDCVRADCGNGVVEGAEQCDGGDKCTNSCTLIVCGDDKVEGSEVCDEGRDNSAQGSCTTDCKRTFCGDNVVQTNEDCDDGKNNATYNGCGAGCKWAGSCGDGKVQSGQEECDSDNSCSDECKKLPSKLEAGDRLYIGDALASGSWRLQVKDNGDIELLNNGGKMWSTSTSGSDGYLTMQGDGNCVVYMGGTSVWSSGTRNGDVLSLENGTLVIKEGSRVIKQIYPVPPTIDSLNVDQRLYAGTTLVAGGTTLTLQGDGNVVLKRDGTTEWKTSTQGNTGAFMVLQGDGNIVVRDTEGTADWSSGTRNGTTLKLSSDSLRLLDGTNIVKQFWPTVTKSTLNSGERLYAGSELTAGNVRLYIQGDGNLLLKDDSSTLWKTNTTGSAGAYAEMRTSGDLAVILKGLELWSSNTTGGKQLVLESTALTIRNSSGGVVVALWEKE